MRFNLEPASAGMKWLTPSVLFAVALVLLTVGILVRLAPLLALAAVLIGVAAIAVWNARNT